MHLIRSEDLQCSQCCLDLLEERPRALSHAFLREENMLGQAQIWRDALNLGSESNFDYKLVVVHIRKMR